MKDVKAKPLSPELNGLARVTQQSREVNTVPRGHVNQKVMFSS